MEEMRQARAFSTPMMKQYQEIKSQHQDCLLFFRLGDFYELFLDDAKIGAQILNITLTKRPRGKDGDIPMAGVPFHAADAYIAKLVKAGYKVAICEQVSEPDTKGIVEREVIRIITPGTILDEKSLEKKENNYTMSISLDREFLGIAVADLSTGDFQTTQLPYQKDFQQILSNEMIRFAPSECIINEQLYKDPAFLKLLNTQRGINIYCYEQWDDFAYDAKRTLKEHFQLESLHVFGIEDKIHAIKSSATLLSYLKHTQKGNVAHIKSLRTYNPSEFVILDSSTIANLELFSTIRNGEQKGSFIQVLDRTQTAMGGRMLRSWIKQPLSKKSEIKDRLDAVEKLLKKRAIRKNIKDLMEQIYDIPRIISRLSVGIGNAPDLINLKQSLRYSLEIKEALSKINVPIFRKLFSNKTKDIQPIISLIENNILDNPSIDTKSGGLIKSGVNEELDQLRAEIGGGKNWIAKLEAQERKRTSISSLKIKFNKVFGYYIEISKPNLASVPENYIRKQTMINAERFITPELKQYEEKILAGEETTNNLEHAIFHQVVQQVLRHTLLLQKLSATIAEIDCLANFAELAEKNNYTKPEFSQRGEISIKEGRHPVVENIQGKQFVPNDVLLNHEGHQLLVITGPNMAGKSVFMRQVALLLLMAHIGCFVPAKKATLSLVDRIFVRSGASDIIASGLSTFMVEMVETAHILNHATKKSFIIMDEIGRGTSTYDGISIAWAVAEYLVTNPKLGTKTLFATHYHELQMLEEHFKDKIKNYNVAVQEKACGDPVFLHKVIPGRSSHSYAVAVAKLAGVPEIVTKKATTLLKQLEKRGDKNNMNNPRQEIPSGQSAKLLPVLDELIKMDLNTLTPIDALNRLASLQKKTKENS